MNIVFFTHPDFLNLQSMPRFTHMLAEGMRQRGHQIAVWSPDPKAIKIPAPSFMKKWLGYIDQFLFFPKTVKKKLRHVGSQTLFVFTDQALGPWVPLVSHLPHVIHCHDFLAQRSANNEIGENRTGWTGKLYQKLIRNGYVKGKHFISVSKKTQNDLHRFLPKIPSISDVVYNGFHQSFSPQKQEMAILAVAEKTGLDLTSGYILHVGGNPWYKNRKGVLKIYNALRERGLSSLPLLMIGEPPSDELIEIQTTSGYRSDIHWLTNIGDDLVKLAYSGASVFLFPSLAEGFGWPIAEAMASGCPVITTGEAPMTEVAADAGFYLKRMPSIAAHVKQWANEGADVINKVLSLSSNERKKVIDAGIQNSKRFDTQKALDEIESIYLSVLKKY